MGHVARMLDAKRLPTVAIFGVVAERKILTGSETKGWRKGRYSSHVKHIVDLMFGADQRAWATQAQNREW